MDLVNALEDSPRAAPSASSRDGYDLNDSECHEVSPDSGRRLGSKLSVSTDSGRRRGSKQSVKSVETAGPTSPGGMLTLTPAVPRRIAANIAREVGSQGQHHVRDMSASVKNAADFRKAATEALDVDDECEEDWRQETIMDDLRIGSVYLLIGNIVVSVTRAIVVVGRSIPVNGCSQWPRASTPEVRVASVCGELVYSALNVLLISLSLRWPHLAIYCGVLLVFFGFLLAFVMSPLEPTCSDRILLALCAAESTHWSDLGSLDCGPQGTTNMQLAMGIAFLLPFSMPGWCVAQIMWVYIAGYLAVTLLNSHLHGEDHFTAVDVGISIAFLVIAQVVVTYKKFISRTLQLYAYVQDRQKREANAGLAKTLQHMLPSHVVWPMVKHPGWAIAESINRASILFITIVNFNEYARNKSPKDLLDFLNRLFSKMDDICTDHKVTKIETVGEEYVAAVGVVPADTIENAATSNDDRFGHGRILIRMIAAAVEMFELQESEGVGFRMGLHTGPVVAGVIGQKLPRFRLFGDTVNTAARMMQRGVDGELQFGDETRVQLPSIVLFQPRGTIELKGKGQLPVYLLDRSNGLQDDSPRLIGISGDVSRRRVSPEFLMDSLREAHSFQTTGTTQFVKISTASSHAAETNRCSRYARAWLHSVVKFLRRLGLFHTVEKLSPEERRRWLKQFIGERVRRQLVPRADRQAAGLVVYTAIEVALTAWSYNPQWGSMPDALKGLYGISRALFVVAAMSWRCIIRRVDWFENSPEVVERWRFVYMCFVMCMLYVSYAAAAAAVAAAMYDARDNQVLDGMTVDEIGDMLHEQPYRITFWQLSFLLWYLGMLTDIRLRVVPAAVFVGTSWVVLAVAAVAAPARALYKRTDHVVGFAILGILGLLVARRDEQNHLHRFMNEVASESAKKRVRDILDTLMPPLVVEGLQRSQGEHPSHHYPECTVAQSDLVGFTKLASTLTPAEVVGVISELFGIFDRLTDTYQVYKIETIGDAYIAGQAVRPLTEKYRPLSVVMFAAEMVRETSEFAKKKGFNLRGRAGVHTGRCTGGIVGREMQRYHLFGELLATVEACESTAPVERVQLSRHAKWAVDEQVRTERQPEEVVTMDARLDAELTTSKGDAVEGEEVGGLPTYLLKEFQRDRYLYDDNEAPVTSSLSMHTTFSMTAGGGVESFTSL